MPARFTNQSLFIPNVALCSDRSTASRRKYRSVQHFLRLLPGRLGLKNGRLSTAPYQVLPASAALGVVFGIDLQYLRTAITHSSFPGDCLDYNQAHARRRQSYQCSYSQCRAFHIAWLGDPQETRRCLETSYFVYSISLRLLLRP